MTTQPHRGPVASTAEHSSLAADVAALGPIVEKRSKAEDARFFDGLRAMLRTCRDVSQHDRANIAIQACLDYGIDEGHRIVAVLVHVGFNAQHAGMRLREGTGNDPARHYWQRNEGRYSLLPPPSAAHIKIGRPNP